MKSISTHKIFYFNNRKIILISFNKNYFALLKIFFYNYFFILKFLNFLNFINISLKIKLE